MADLIIINKTDLVKEEELSRTRDTVRSVPLTSQFSLVTYSILLEKVSWRNSQH